MQTIDVVVVGLASGVSKTFYPGQYVEGSAEKPDCMSANGVTPDVGVPHRQSAHCGTCPQNQWGSRTTAQGKRAKACQDARRLAIVPSGDEANDNFGGPMLFRIPAMSLVALDRYCRDLERMNVDISQVVTRLGFEASMAYPSITFQAVGWVQSAEAYAIVAEHVQSEAVNRIINESGLEPAGTTVDQPSGTARWRRRHDRCSRRYQQAPAPSRPRPRLLLPSAGARLALPAGGPAAACPACPAGPAGPTGEPDAEEQPPPSRRHSSGPSRCRLRSVRRGPGLAAAGQPHRPSRPGRRPRQQWRRSGGNRRP